MSHSIVSDHLGTPVLMADAAGEKVWSAGISAYGELRDLEGERFACPFRWPGQYEDAETGLYYNRFRYYDAEAGQYTSQDPIRSIKGLVLQQYAVLGIFSHVSLIDLSGGSSSYGYVPDPMNELDPWGLIRLLSQDGVEVHAYPGPQATSHRPDHKPLHVHVLEKGQKTDTRVLMEDWTENGKVKGAKGKVYPGDRALTKREKKVVGQHMDTLPSKADSVFRTGRC